MSKFNPNEPLTIGLEWAPTETVTEAVDFGREIGLRVVPTTSVVVSGGRFHQGGPVPGGLDKAFTNIMLMTIYREDQVNSTGEVRQQARIASTGTTSGGVLTGGATVLECVQGMNDGKYVTIDSTDTITLNFSPSAGFLTTKPRIMDVSFDMILTPVTTGCMVEFSYQPQGITMGTIDVATNGSYYLHTGEIFLAAYDYTPLAPGADPRRRPWATGDLTNLQSGSVDFRIQNVAGTCRVDYVGVTVTYCEENRTGVGGLIRTTNPNYGWDASFLAWVGEGGGPPGTSFEFFEIKTPTGSTGVTLSAGVPYLVLVTRATDVDIDGLNRATAKLAPSGGPVHFQFGNPIEMTALQPANSQIDECRVATRLSNGLLASTPVAMDRSCAISLHGAGGQGTDLILPELSQPYAWFHGEDTALQTQRMRSPQTAVYTSATVRIRRFGAPADCSFTFGGSGGGALTITNADYNAADKDPNGWALITKALSSPATFTANVSRDVAAIPGTGTDRWEIGVLDSTASPAYEIATYGGTTLFSSPAEDLALTLSTSVATVTGATVTRFFQQLESVLEPTTACRNALLRSMDAALFSWGQVPVISGSPLVTGAPLVTGFSHYEVQRKDAIDTDWLDIAHISTRDNTFFIDYEGRINTVSDYRVRQCRLDGVCGAYATVTGFTRLGASTASTAPLVTGGCEGLIFTSNEDPLASVAYPYFFAGGGVAPVENWQFYEPETVVLQRVHGRDFMVALRPSERGGTRFQRTMLVNAVTVPTKRLDRRFRSLRDLAWDTLPYVCVLDHRGGRWFAAVLVPSGDMREGRQVYLANIDVIEVTDTPSVVDA